MRAHAGTAGAGARMLGVRMLALVLALGAWPAPASAQESIRQLARKVGDGTVRLEFRARPGVCGNGQSMSFFTTERGRRNRNGEWESECDPGPVRVALDVADGAPTSIRYYVGGRWGRPGDAVEGGTVGAAEAAAYFAQLAERAAPRVAKEAIVVATLADSANIWPALLRVAKDDRREREVRKTAVFWLGQAAGETVAPLTLLADDNDEDIEVRKHAVFALSQRPREEAIPALLKIVRGKGDARVRKQAIFWLGQSGDERAVAYFEEVLTRPK